MALYHSARGSNNYTIVGSPTVVDNVVSDFSSSNYILAADSFAPTGAWEIIIKIKTPNGNASKYFIGGGYNFAIGTTNTPAKHFKAFFSSNGTSWNIGNITSSLSISNDVWYYVRVGFNGTEYYMDYSTDGKNYIDRRTKASTAKLYASSFLIGQTGIFPTLFWNGEIDLKETYAFVDGQPFFGICPVEVQKHQLKGPVGYTVVGSPTITDGVASGFSGSDYVKILNFPSGSFAGNIRAKLNSDATGWNSLFFINSNSPVHRFSIENQGDGSSVNIRYYVYDTTTSSNKSYTKYNLNLKEVWVDYNFVYNDTTHQITINVVDVSTQTALNTATYSNVEFIGGNIQIGYYWHPFNGSIDLNETYVKVNGKLWYWQPRETERIVVNGVEVWSKPQES